MKIAIVNDLFIAVELLRRIIQNEPLLKICWVAENGKVAIEKCKNDLPDLILMDLIMPILDGVEATRIIMQTTPCPILVVTATVSGNSSKVFEAMSFGALDAVNTPIFSKNNSIEGKKDLLSKIEIIGRLIGLELSLGKSILSVQKSHSNLPNIIAIGASTGGPGVIAKILKEIHLENYCLIIAQHVDEKFAQDFCNWLIQITGKKIKIAEENESPVEGIVYIAGKNSHLILEQTNKFHYTKEDFNQIFKPSVDVLFQSIADLDIKCGIAIVLTGMGTDGASGMLKLKQKKWLTIAQDEKSSIVYGMPKAAKENLSATFILSPSQISSTINNYKFT